MLLRCCFILASLVLALAYAANQGSDSAKAPQIRFRQARWNASTALPETRAYGIINRVHYRSASGSSFGVEREPVSEPDPQKTTLPHPVPIPGAAWVSELPGCAPPSAKFLGWGDFDADGSDELLVGWPAMICKRKPDGAWVRVAEVKAIPRESNIVVADGNGDGLADIVLPGNHPQVFWNETRLPWIRHVIAHGFRTQTIVAADFAGHSRLDVISGDIENDHKISMFSAPDWRPSTLISGIRVIQSLALDVDGDGDIDYIGAQYHPGLIFWLEHPQDPLHQKWTFHLIDDAKKGGADGVHGLALADIDADGKAELIAMSDWPEGGFPNSILSFKIPPGARSEQRWSRFVLANHDAPGFAHYIGIGDVNRDGLIDVATGAKSGPDGNWFAWWEHPRDFMQPWIKHVIATGQPGATNILIYDLNGDGKPDFLASRGHGKGIVWFEAPEWEPHEVDTRLVGPHAIAIADLDGDGDPDFVVCAKDSGVLAWYENDGRGGFTEHRISEDQSAYELKLVDLNQDGAPDILVAGQESQNVVWFENRLSAR